MRVVETAPALTLSANQVRDNTGIIDAESAFASDQDVVLQALQALGYACTQADDPGVKAVGLHLKL